jgi:hypothetical protein
MANCEAYQEQQYLFTVSSGYRSSHVLALGEPAYETRLDIVDGASSFLIDSFILTQEVAS